MASRHGWVSSVTWVIVDPSGEPFVFVTKWQAEQAIAQAPGAKLWRLDSATGSREVIAEGPKAAKR